MTQPRPASWPSRDPAMEERGHGPTPTWLGGERGNGLALIWLCGGRVMTNSNRPRGLAVGRGGSIANAPLAPDFPICRELRRSHLAHRLEVEYLCSIRWTFLSHFSGKRLR